MTKTTTRQDKVRATIAKLNARLEKFENGGYDSKYQKQFGDKPTTSFVVAANEKYSNHTVIELPNGETQPIWKYWRDCEKFNLLEQITNNEKKLQKAIELDAKEDAKIAKANDRTAMLESIPECLKKFAAEVEAAVIADKIRIHNYLSSLPYPHFRDNSQLANEIRRNRWFDEEKMREEVKRGMEDLVLDLLYRVEKKCGSVVSTDDLYIEHGNQGCVINGWVKGDKGQARVQSIMAGGYNIQCLHIRVLVK